MALVMVLCLLPSMTLAANSTGHKISVELYKVVLDNTKPLGYQNPEWIGTTTVTCQDGTAHSGYNHFVNLKDFYPTEHGLSTDYWTGWQFNGYYEKGNDRDKFYNWTSDRVDATANVTGSEPYPCSKNFYYVYRDSNPTPPPSATPSQPDANTLKNLLGKIKVTCVINDTAHGTKGFDLIDGSYTVDAVGGDAISGYTCEVSISPDKYVDEYNKLINGHTVTEATAKIVTLKYNNYSAWVVNTGTPVEFNVTCSDEDETFTVTYLDGFSGTYATYTNLKSGVVTPVPANPYRSGYIFLGWEPSVEPTVTGNAEYVAQWGYIGPQYPNPTPVQPVQPGILPPQTGDMPLWYAIARFLGLVK